jgi:hypothetical protein
MGNHNSSESQGLFWDRNKRSDCEQFYVDTFQSLVVEYRELEQRPGTTVEHYRDLYGRVMEVIDRLPEFCGPADELPYLRFSEHLRWRIQGLSTGGGQGVPRPPRSSGHVLDDSVTVFAGRFLSASPAAAALDIVRRTPVIPPRLTLVHQMDIMVPHVRDWLLQLGRNPNYGQVVDREGNPTGKDLYMELGGTMPERKAPDARFVLGGRFALSGREVNELRDAARYSVGVIEIQQPVGPAGVYKPSGENSWDYEDIRDDIKRSEYESMLSTLVGVTGPVYVTFDNEFQPQTKAGRPITLVSVAGLSFQRDRVESKLYTEVTGEGERRIRPDKVDFVQTHIQRMLHHIFKRYQQFGCDVPVLCAIGCGVFAAGMRDVPGYYARAMAHLLSTKPYGFSAVVVSLVTPADFVAFRTAFADVEESLRTTVILTLHRSMIHVADRLARADIHAGMLNPSDPIAVRSGYIGYQFDGGHAALEEILGLQTTMLLHHKGANPTLYTDPSRFDRIAVGRGDSGPRRTSSTWAMRTDPFASLSLGGFCVHSIRPM